MTGKLYLVATPIGNMGDMTLRGLEVLKSVDVIACEDTRHTLGLLNKFEIKKPLISYYKQKEREGTEQITEILDSGKNVALVTDAGMPCISDPGSILVEYLLENNYEYTIVPGANAAVSAVSLTGVKGPFTFIGFLPEKNKDAVKILNEFKNVNSNLIFYSAPHDVNKILDLLYRELNDRTVYIVKEITKIFETVIKGTLGKTRVENPKGEFVLIVEPCEKKCVSDENEIERLLKIEMENGADKKQAIRNVSEKYDIPKNTIYKISINI